MPIDRRTFVLGSGVASTVGAFASFAAVASVGAGAEPPLAAAPLSADAAGLSFELRILGWDRSDDHAALASTAAADTTAWIAIDPQWRGAWR